MRQCCIDIQVWWSGRATSTVLHFSWKCTCRRVSVRIFTERQIQAGQVGGPIIVHDKNLSRTDFMGREGVRSLISQPSLVDSNGLDCPWMDCPSLMVGGRGWSSSEGVLVQLLTTAWKWHCKVGLMEFIRQECTSSAGCGYFNACPLKYRVHALKGHSAQN